jgi:hypothetical protein
MKYLITESKLDHVIYDYLDELFAAENGNTEIYKLEVFSTQPENRNEPLEGQYDFVNDDYYETNNQEYLFSWTGKEYYESITPNYITNYEYEMLASKAPIVSINDVDRVKKLDSYFGDLWKPAFKKWFKDKTEMDYKTLHEVSY